MDFSLLDREWSTVNRRSTHFTQKSERRRQRELGGLILSLIVSSYFDNRGPRKRELRFMRKYFRLGFISTIPLFLTASALASPPPLWQCTAEGSWVDNNITHSISANSDLLQIEQDAVNDAVDKCVSGMPDGNNSCHVTSCQQVL